MALKMKDLRERITTTTVTWGEDTVEVGYFPAALTPERIDAIAKAAGDLKGTDGTEALDASVAMFADMLGGMVAWWDVLDDDGERLPVTADTIRILPMPFTMAVLDQVQGALMPEGSRG
jgi:hypothetical protein